MTEQVLILGVSGRVGRYSARSFENAGWSTRLFVRKKDDMMEAAKGCDVIVNGLNPQDYHDWENTLPKITHEVINAAKANGATVILPGNVYHYGDKAGIWSERTAPDPCSRKGELRLQLEHEYAQSGVQTIVLRAGNFIDPELRTCVLGQLYFRNIGKDKVTLPSAAGIRQAMCYVGDWADAALKLANMRKDLSLFEDVPIQGYTLTGNEIKRLASKALKRKLDFNYFPWWLLTLAAPFWELGREMKEMRYLFDTDHSLSNEKLLNLIPDFNTTPVEEVFHKFLVTA